MKTLITAFLLLLLGSACSTSPGCSNRETFIRNFLQKYPKATLQDIYKTHFQDKFGPAHLLTDREAVKKYILHEMETAEKLEGDEFQACGWQGNFYQVNLSIIREGKITLDEFTDAFIASANGIDTTLTQAWLNEWDSLQQVVKVVAPELKGFKEDSLFLAQLLEGGKYVVHHSRVFNQHYHPHYRIIRKDIFKEKILPKL